MALAGADFDTPQFSKDELKQSPHSHYSALSFDEWIDAKVTKPAPKAVGAIMAILAGHHGIFPTKLEVTGPKNYEAERRLHWHAERFALWDRAAATAGITDAELKTLATTPLTQPEIGRAHV